MSDKYPCCMGCVMYGHSRGCTCTLVQRRTVELPVLAVKRLLEGKATAADQALLDAAVARELR